MVWPATDTAQFHLPTCKLVQRTDPELLASRQKTNGQQQIQLLLSQALVFFASLNSSTYCE